MLNQGKYLKRMPPTSIVNLQSGGGDYLSVANYGAKTTLSGALTANTYKEILSVTGRGVFYSLYAISMDTTSRKIGLKIVIDEVTVFDAVSGTLTSANQGIAAGGYSNIVIPIYFNKSLVASVKSSLSETDKVGLGHIYHLF